MATKDYCVRLKEKNNLTATTDKFRNLNLNKSNCNLSPVYKHYQNNDKSCVTDKGGWNNNNNDDGGYERVKKKFDLKPVIQKTNLIYSSVLPPSKPPTTTTIEKSSSTLSLHIAAYEDLITGLGDRENLNKKPEPMNCGLSTSFFEFPRQQKESNNPEPEIAQFKASQKLLNPNLTASGTGTCQNVGTAKQKAAKPGATTATTTTSSSSSEDEEENANEKVVAEFELNKAIREKAINFKFVYPNNFFTQNGSFFAPKSKNKPEEKAEIKEAVEEIMKQFEELIKKKNYLACGEFGSVSLCEVRGLNPQFVQKTFLKLKEETLEAELGVYDKMTSEFFPKLLMAGIGAKNLYHMVIEYINCGTLYDHREQIQPADIPFMVLQVATAIQQLHEFQLTHGDIKTDNIGIRENGHIVMLDFGCSRFVGYLTNELPITPLCAPEVYEREDAGLPSDWYSVGMMMLQLYQKAEEPRLKILTRDPLANEFITELTKEKPEDRPLNVFDHEYLKRRNLKPSFFPSQLPSKKKQAPQRGSPKKLSDETIDDIYEKSLIRLPSKNHFYSFN